MAKRQSIEAKVLAYFTEASVEKVELMLGLVRDVVRRRITPTRVVKAKTRAAKVPGGTAFEPAALAQ